MFEALGNDELGFFGCAAFSQQYGAGFFNAIDIRLSNHATDLAIEVFQARNDHDRVVEPVGDLDEIADSALEAFFRIVEEPQVLDLIDTKHQRRAFDRPHQRAKCGDDFKSAVFAGIGVQRYDGFMRDRRQQTAVQILADALIDARIAALQI